MLHRCLQFCLLAVAAILLAGDGWACAGHETALQQSSLVGSSDAGSPGKIRDTLLASTANAQDDAQAVTPSLPFEVVLRQMAPAHVFEILTTGLGEYACCNTADCVHVGACASACCAAASFKLAQSSREQERRFAVSIAHKPAIAQIGIGTRPTIADGEEHRRRFRDAKTLQGALHEPRLAKMARLTI